MNLVLNHLIKIFLKMKKTCVIMQPTYLPWIGYFDLIKQADVFVFLSDVQFSKQGWQVKNKIKNKESEITLTIPVKRAPLNTLINQTKIDMSKRWKKTHLKSIYYSYIKSKFFSEVYPFIENLYSYDTNSLSEFNIHIIKSIVHQLHINTKIVDSTSLIIDSKDKLDRIIKICSRFNANSYLSTPGSLEYLEKMNYKEKFKSEKINFITHQYNHPIYKQVYEPFTSNLSILDLFFNVGFKKSKYLTSSS